MSYSADNLENPKLFTLEEAVKQRARYRETGERLVLTNGCFDLLHTGHLYFLREAAKLGDQLWIAINSDASVKELKGPSRPVMNEYERAYALAALEFVSGVFIFRTPRLDNEIRTVQPDIYAKAGDYTLETLNPQERQALEECGTDIRFMPFLEGYSTTSLIKKINDAANTF